MYHAVKKKVHGLLHPEIVGDKNWDKVINVFIVVLIILNIVAVMLETVKPILTKKGDQMAFATITDYTGSIELVFFSKLFADNKDTIMPEKCVALKGRLSMRNNEPSIVVDAIKAL